MRRESQSRSTRDRQAWELTTDSETLRKRFSIQQLFTTLIKDMQRDLIHRDSMVQGDINSYLNSMEEGKKMEQPPAMVQF